MSSVLIVDDEHAIRELLGRWLTAAGHEVREAATAETALDAMAVAGADVVMCDIEMPGHGGIWLAEELRRRFPASAMILATALDTVPAVTSLKSGIVDYLVKPFDRERVELAVAAGVAWHDQAVQQAHAPAVPRGSIATWLESSLDRED